MVRFQLLKKNFVLFVTLCLFTALAFQNCTGKLTSQASSEIETGVLDPLATPVVIPKSLNTIISVENYLFEFEIQGAKPEQVKSLQCQLDQKPISNCTTQTAFQLTALADGDHIIKIKVTTKAGVVVEKSVQFRKDATAPMINVQSYPSISTTSLTERIEFSASDGVSGLRQTECSLNNEVFRVCASPQNLTLSLGPQTFRIRATDYAGNVSVVRNLSWTVNEIPAPVFEITDKPSAFTNESTVRLAFSGTDIVKYECRIDNGSFADCTFNYTTEREGSHIIEVRAQNNLGRWSDIKNITWYFDKTIPSKPVLTHSIAAISKDPNPQISILSQDAGSGIAKYECQTSSGPGFQDCSSLFILNNLRQGDNEFTARAVDKANNVSEEAKIIWILDTDAPQTPMIRFSNMGPAYEFTNSFTLDSYDFGTGLDRYSCSVNSQPLVPCNQVNSFATLTAGDYVIEAVAIDKAGNISQKAIAQFNRQDPPLYVKQEVCMSMVSKPTLIQSTLIIQASSGQALGTQFHTSDPLIKPVSVLEGISDNVRFTQWGCGAVLQHQLKCQVVVGDPEKPVKVTHAISDEGFDLLNGHGDNANQALQDQIALNSLDSNGCNVTFEPEVLTANFVFRLKFPSQPMSPQMSKCLAASYTLKLSAKTTTLSGPASGLESDPVYIPVSVTNACWDEVSSGSLNPTNTPTASNSQMGEAVQVSNVTAASLATEEVGESNPSARGAVYLYDHSNGSWAFYKKLSSERDGERFVSMSLYLNTLVIGVENATGDSGALLLYVRSTDGWNFSYRLDRQSSPGFGRKVKVINGNTLATVSRAGIYTYEYKSYEITRSTERSYPMPSSPLSMFHLDADGSRLIVAVDNSIEQSTSTVNVYELASGALTLRRTYSGSGADGYASSVSIQQKAVAIGSQNFSDLGMANVGKVDYYSDYSILDNTPTKTLKGKSPSEFFGSAVKISSAGEVVIGARADFSIPSRIYYFSSYRDAEPFVIYPQLGRQSLGSMFGASVAIDGMNVVVGAPRMMSGSPQSGNMFFYKIKP